MTDYRDNIEIDLFDLLKFILNKWKILLIAAIVGAIFGGAYAAVAPSSDETSAVEDTDTLSNKLTAREKSDADLAYRAYQQCLELYDQFEEQPKGTNAELRIELVKATQQILDASKGFIGDQKLYYASLFSDDDKIITSNTHAQPAQRTLFKYIIIGALGGVFFVILIFSLKYIIAPVLKIEDDLRSAFHLSVIGTIDRAGRENIDIIVSSIMACANNIQARSLSLISSDGEAVTKEIQDKIGHLLDEKDVSVRSKGNVIADSVTIDDIASSDGVILFERIGHSRYENIAREIELCSNSGIPIIGVVVIK